MFQVCQRSAFAVSHYQALDSQGGLLADLIWPKWSQAKNARLRWHEANSPEGDVQIRMGETVYRVGFEYLSRGFTNETRFTLHQGAEPMSVVDVVHPKGRGLKRMDMRMTLPLCAKLSPSSRWGRVRYRLEQEDPCLGVVEETRRFTLKREMSVDLPQSLSLPVQLFIAVMVLHAAFN